MLRYETYKNVSGSRTRSLKGSYGFQFWSRNRKCSETGVEVVFFPVLESESDSNAFKGRSRESET